jgi:arylsulfatase A-like enzyme
MFAMRLLYLDIDTLRPDHLGCYGYHRNTSPNIDRIAAQGVRFESCYVSDAPCLPSRASMFTGMFGIRNGVVGHGGTAADLRIIGEQRGFRTEHSRPGLIASLRHQCGHYPVTVSPFGERHSAFWWYEGWREIINPGKGGSERSDEVVPLALDWLDRNAQRDDWLLHVNVWDPHTVYQAPEEFGNPFEDEPIEDWYTEELRQKQWNDYGPGTPQEPCGGMGREKGTWRQPPQVRNMDEYKQWIDGYDCGVAYADMWVGRILDKLEEQGVLDETTIVITSDHGETLGELNVIGDHATADHVVSRVPMIVRYPGQPGGRVDEGLYNQCDIGATLVELGGGEVPEHWDGRSFAEQFRAGDDGGRDYVVFSQCAWSCQRAVRWNNWVYIRTYHTGLKNYPRHMLFDVAEDPHELSNLAESRPELVGHAQTLLDEWWADEMSRNPSGVDPLWTVMQEGGPFHTRWGNREHYLARLRETGRGDAANFLEANPTGLAD